MCNCGCNTCETKIRGPLLTEGKVKSLLSEGLQYHIDKKIPLFETVYRIGSDKHLALIKEARKMYSRNIIDLCEEDEALIKTHLGEFALYEGVAVPLDLPMLNEYQGDGTNKISDDKLTRLVPKMPKGYVGKNTGIGEYTISTPDGEDIVLTQSKDKKNWVYEPSNVALKILNESKYDKEETIQQTIDRLKARIEDPNDGGNVPFLLQKIKDLEKSLEEVTRYSGFNRNPEDPDSKPLNPTWEVNEFKADLRRLFGKFKGELKNPEFIKGVAEIMVNWKALLRSQLDEAQNPLLKQNKLSSSEYQKAKKLKGFNKDNYKWNADEDLYIKSIDEAEFKGKDVPLNKPKRGGSKAYYVYVRDPKTKKIKKVSFGSGGLRAKIKNKEARNAFAARHNCKNKKDRTKAGYWSCNLPRYASALGLGANMNTFW